MKWIRTIILFDRGDVISSDEWRRLHESYIRAIQSIDHPKGSGTLTLRLKQKLPGKQWKRNGVNYLKTRFLESMTGSEGWKAEGEVPLGKDRRQPPLLLYPSLEEYREPVTSNFGGFDFMIVTDGGVRAAIEWETGNISSSHRSMNKLAIALRSGILDIGVLVVPSRALYENLTDRVGNIGELSGYLAMWNGLKSEVNRGLLAVTVVEHDHLTDSEEIGYLPVGRDGRAKQGKSKLKT